MQREPRLRRELDGQAIGELPVPARRDRTRRSPAPAGSRTLERASDAASEGRSAAPSSFEPDLGSLHG